MIARWQAGTQTWTQTWSLAPDQRVVSVLSALRSLNKLCGIWIRFGYAEVEKLRQALSGFQHHSLFQYKKSKMAMNKQLWNKKQQKFCLFHLIDFWFTLNFSDDVHLEKFPELIFLVSRGIQMDSEYILRTKDTRVSTHSDYICMIWPSSYTVLYSG